MTTKRTPLSVAAVLAASLGLLLAGCAAPGVTDEQKPAAGQEAAPEGSSEEPTEGSNGEAQGSPGGPAAPLDDLGTREALEDASITLNTVHADSEAMTVMFTVTNNGDEALNLGNAFGNGVQDAKDDAVDYAETRSVDGVFVVADGKRYLVGRGENGLCACSANVSATAIESGASAGLSAVFAAPPESVERVEVHIPQAGAFVDLELSGR